MPLKADEAQHGHHNDGHNPSSSTPVPLIPPRPVCGYDGIIYNPYEERRMPTIRLSKPDFPSSIASGQEGDIGAGGMSPLHAPQQHKTLKTVSLFRGNFVLDSPVPSKLLDKCVLRNKREFTHMRYSAATCDPNEFQNDLFTLRQSHHDPPRHTELFIVMTMYNEDEELFCRSMQGVMKNIAYLCHRRRSKTWGKDGWKKVVVCIVSDGRRKINPRTLCVLAMMGVYQDGIAKVCTLNRCLDSADGRKECYKREARNSSHLRVYNSK